jgi:large subunit ribosomal protein L21
MYAIVETSGRQFKVAEGDRILVDRMQAEVGAEITLDRVLMLHGDDLVIGAPCVPGVSISARVVEHSRGEKVTSFKFVRTRRYRRRHGYRHSHTLLEIVGVNTTP